MPVTLKASAKLAPKKKVKKIKHPITPRSHIKHALRLIWLHSRERRAKLMAAGYCCERCGVKQSTAKGREVKVEIHHRFGIDWEEVVDLIIERILQDPSSLEALCFGCHEKADAERKNLP